MGADEEGTAHPWPAERVEVVDLNKIAEHHGGKRSSPQVSVYYRGNTG
jgi:hypothetical protein